MDDKVVGVPVGTAPVVGDPLVDEGPWVGRVVPAYQEPAVPPGMKFESERNERGVCAMEGCENYLERSLLAGSKGKPVYCQDCIRVGVRRRKLYGFDDIYPPVRQADQDWRQRVFQWQRVDATLESLDAGASRMFRALRDMMLSADELKARPLKAMAPLNELKQYRVIAVRGARQTGHTTVLSQIGKVCFKRPLYVFKTSEMARLACRLHALPKDSVSYVANFAARARGLEPDGVLVDTASLLSTTAQDRLLRACVPYLADNPKFFVLLIG